MGDFFAWLLVAIREGRYIVGEHASARLQERGIMEWHVISGMSDAKLLEERPRARPNATVKVRIALPDGSDCDVVWSRLRSANVAKLVTVFYPRED